ncbi:hypothetical protein GUITHDRAFT_115744 [Guillardia theta CCMP2712]|uniref:Uncharacterized protein n=1 Tax=Guillardia theta (strain CCMP2712) TaxID=905079 RepID=L1IQP2_GUITC|nr:hypothetical protein GUITHDRAFT_115744 [Guillardia theta CCMP2712]EKX38199.1 hypothetical protein GUITHDRAFT_115744 [Guillardia theta CCMP2712]|eukprot:XP_005825179.1 hypothetical protein GUITHDRAFT_115744 [Guillardia theta CCMP2712]
MFHTRFEVWVCDYDNRCVQQTGNAMCFVFDEVQEVFLPWGLDSQLLVTQQEPFQSNLAVSHILAKLKALEQEIRSGGCGGSCVSRQQVQQLLDQYYLEPGYLWSAGSSSLCGRGVARRSITCISKLLEQVEDVRCSNRSKPLAETCAAEGKTCVSSAINQIDNEEAMRSAVRAASIASDRPGGLHLRVSAGAHEQGGDGLQDLTASSGHVKRRRYVEHGATNFPLVPQSGPNAGRTCCSITQNFYVDVPVELQGSRTITISITIEGADNGNIVEHISDMEA